MTTSRRAFRRPRQGAADANVPVLFFLYTGDDWPPFPAETVTARLVDDFVVEVTGVPWFAYGISRGDHVAVTHDGAGYIGRHVKTPGGHSTIRVMATTDVELAPIADALRAVGAHIVAADDLSLLAVDIPPSVDLAVVRRTLSTAESMTCDFEVSADQHSAPAQ